MVYSCSLLTRVSTAIPLCPAISAAHSVLPSTALISTTQFTQFASPILSSAWSQGVGQTPVPLTTPLGYAISTVQSVLRSGLISMDQFTRFAARGALPSTDRAAQLAISGTHTTRVLGLLPSMSPSLILALGGVAVAGSLAFMYYSYLYPDVQKASPAQDIIVPDDID